MGPERFSKQYQAVKASDIWSLGVSIFELATNELPFCGMGGSLLKQGADMPELPEEFSETLNMVCQSCMAKEPWNRPTAQQLADFAAKHMDGENPKPAWIKEDKASVKEDVAEKLVEERIPVAVKTYAEPVKEEPEAKLEKKTVIAAGDLSGKTIRVGGGEVVTPPDVRFVEQKPDQKSLGAAVWVAAAAAGIVLGFILNYFI